MSNSGYADSLVLSSLNTGVKIFTDKKGKGKNNQSDLSLLKLFKKNVVPQPRYGFDDPKVFAANISSI